MLESTQRYYQRICSNIDWKNCDRNELFRKCSQCQEGSDEYYEYYAALVCRNFGYVNVFYNYYYPKLTQDQCYDMLVNILNYALKNKVWDRKLRNDKKGPEKAFNMSKKQEMYITKRALDTHKRRANNYVISTDKMKEEYADFSDTIVGSLEYDQVFINIAECYAVKGKLLEATIVQLLYEGTKKKKVAMEIQKLCKERYNVLNVYGVDDRAYYTFLDEFSGMDRKHIKNRVMTVIEEFKKELGG